MRVLFIQHYAHNGTVSHRLEYGILVSMEEDRFVVIGLNGKRYWKHLTNIISCSNFEHNERNHV